MLVAQSCLTLCDTMDCSPPGSSVHEIFQARILEWITISFSRGSSQPRDGTQVSCTAGRFFLPTELQGKPIYTISFDFCLWLTSLQRMIMSRFIQVLQMALFNSFYELIIFHCVNLLYLSLCSCTFRLLLCLGYCKSCCCEHWHACIFLNCVFFFPDL